MKNKEMKKIKKKNINNNINNSDFIINIFAWIQSGKNRL